MAEFLVGLERVEQLETGLCLPGHGGRSATFHGRSLRTGWRSSGTWSACGRARRRWTAFEVAGEIIIENLNPATAAWGLQLALAYLDHLGARGEAVEVDGADPRRWRAA